MCKQNQLLNTRELKNFLDDRLVGQDKAKKLICMALKNQVQNFVEPDEYSFKKNLFLIGAKGSGKSELMTAVENYMDLPVVFFDAYTLRANKENAAQQVATELLKEVEYDFKRASHAIIVIENLDYALTNDPSKYLIDKEGMKFLNELVIMLEDAITINVQMDEKNDPIEFDFRDNMFIVSAVLEGITTFVRFRKGSNKIGFLNDIISKDLYEEIESEDLINYGLTSNFVACFQNIVSFKKRTRDEIVQIITNSDILKFYANKFNDNYGVALEIEEVAIEKLAEHCLEKRLGLWSIRNIIERKLSLVEFETEDTDAKEVVIDTFLDA